MSICDLQHYSTMCGCMLGLTQGPFSSNPSKPMYVVICSLCCCALSSLVHCTRGASKVIFVPSCELASPGNFKFKGHPSCFLTEPGCN